MKILLIEDNLRLAERVRYYLGKSFIVDTVNTGEEGKNKALATEYGVILLDLNLPDVHGLEICRELRKARITTPILVISGIKDSGSRINLLDTGADDYLVKPFDPRELIARIHALSRRHEQGYNHHILKVKDLVIDVNRRQVTRAGQPITLRRKEFDILEYLVCNRGRTVTRSMILEYAWDTTKESWHNTIDVHIKYLRDKIDKPFDSPIIKTAYGVGYMVDDTT
jgi:DNA-binding response OmpR family regulator